MPKEIIEKKIEQIRQLIKELKELLISPFEEFYQDSIKLRAAERTFQLIVDIASDINTQILLDRGEKSPDTYRQSFEYIARAKIIPASLGQELALSAGLRNILVHEYDFETDYRRFYDSAKRFIPHYQEYTTAIIKYLG